MYHPDRTQHLFYHADHLPALPRRIRSGLDGTECELQALLTTQEQRTLLLSLFLGRCLLIAEVIRAYKKPVPRRGRYRTRRRSCCRTAACRRTRG